MVTIWKDGKVVSRSKNLRGIMVRARKLAQSGKYPTKTLLTAVNDRLDVLFPDGSKCHVVFADASVLAHWMADRSRLVPHQFEENIN